MRPELILGFDPAPADRAQLSALQDALRAVVRGVVAARGRVVALLGRSGPVWDGAAAAPVAGPLQRLVQRHTTLEEALVDVLRVLEVWETGVVRRQDRAEEVVAAVADLAGDETAKQRRAGLIQQGRELAAEHERAAADLRRGLESFSEAVASLAASDDDLPADLDRALTGLETAVEEWIEAEGPELLRTARSLAEVVELTTVVSELVGIAALGRTPGDAHGVGALVARSPASYRLVRALRQQWADLPPEALADASFADRRYSRGETVRARLERSSSADPVIPHQQGRTNSDVERG